MNINLFLMLGGGSAVPTIQITTPAYLDPAKMRVGDVIGAAFTSGTYPDFQGNPVVEASVAYTVDGGAVLASYVLQSGDVVGAALVHLTAGAATRDYYAEPSAVYDLSFSTADITFTVPAGTGSIPNQFAAGDWSVADAGTNGDATVTITTLPADGGSAITALEYQIDSGSWASFGGTTTRTYAVSGFTDGTAANVSVRAVNAIGNGPASAAKSVTTTGAPDAFTSGMWTLTDLATGGDARIAISALPSANGSAITDLERKIGAGAWTSLGGTATGNYDVAGFTDGVTTNVLIRAKNAKGNGPDSDSKSVTTSAAPSGPALITDGNLINTSTPGTTPAILGSITAQAGDMIVILLGTCRNTGGSAMAVSATWNGESFAETTQLLHSGGRATSHVLTLVAASSGTFTPIVTCSNSAAAVGADYFVIRGQSGSPIKQHDSNTATSALTCSKTLTAPNTGSIILAGACQRYSTTGNPTDMTVGAPFTQDSHFRTGTGNNLDLIFSAGHYVTPNSSNVTATVTSDGAQNITLTITEIF